ncbi:hypothetical protein AB1K42_25485 [Roseibium algicola]|uniref:hypothetical protein n=1 Tax=Roseibium algicola TaxID=2857014 RepID=UPI0034573E02
MAEETRRGYSIRIESVRSLVDDPNLSDLRDKLATSPSSGPTFESLIQSSEGNAEVLLIDGEIVPHIETDEGIRIYYQPPEQSLLEAARSFVDTQPETSQ